MISSRNYNKDPGLDVVFDLFLGRVFTVTSTCTFIRVCKTPGVGAHAYCRVIVYTSPVNKSKTTSSPASVLQFTDAIYLLFYTDFCIFTNKYIHYTAS